MNNTTRRYPRSMADAFPDVRAHCIEGPIRFRHAKPDRIVMVACAIGAVVLVGFGLVGWMV